MKIRQMTPSDIIPASEIVGQNYSEAYEKISVVELGAMFKDNLLKPEYYVAEENGEILAFGGIAQSWLDYNVYEIFWLNVRPRNQRMGIGTKLVSRLIEDLKKSHLLADIIIVATDKPEFFAEKFGFKALLKYNNDADCLMGLELR